MMLSSGEVRRQREEPTSRHPAKLSAGCGVTLRVCGKTLHARIKQEGCTLTLPGGRQWRGGRKRTELKSGARSRRWVEPCSGIMKVAVFLVTDELNGWLTADGNLAGGLCAGTRRTGFGSSGARLPCMLAHGCHSSTGNMKGRAFQTSIAAEDGVEAQVQWKYQHGQRDASTLSAGDNFPHWAPSVRRAVRPVHTPPRRPRIGTPAGASDPPQILGYASPDRRRRSRFPAPGHEDRSVIQPGMSPVIS